ncbi:hypothetical protein SAMN05421738_11715 [Algoriella xinjiangensis]|uniref:Uncharacterized protein n=1 Tax=Algoriella xinjiangensis TaxID=684065 RepID=A0A1I5AIM1_9FLAO|nr:hypothetical protein [Algoriella xinjiangensis]SFN62232.1 hypothetical protein SAMN05421738_11715 [Algoriella xinjiangensis]VDH16257.1 Uncharacterised protein [Algoriella xinjiangensis]
MKKSLITAILFSVLFLNSCQEKQESKRLENYNKQLNQSPLLNETTQSDEVDNIQGAWIFTHIFDDELHEFIEIESDEKNISFNENQYWTNLFDGKEISGQFAFITPYDIAFLDEKEKNKARFFITILDETDINNLEIKVIKDTIQQRYKIALEVR